MKSVLAVFAKAPIPGKVKTRLTPELSPEQGAELYRCMLLDTIARVLTLGVDVVVFFEGDDEQFRGLTPGVRLIRQHQGGLGERLEQAFSQLASLGYRNRVVIGSDAPDLPLDFVREAFRLLARDNDVVLGPAEDGGYYLVALSGGYGRLFREIPWSGPEVLSTSRLRACESGLSVALLPAWYDVDSYQDLFRASLSDPCNGAPLTRGFLAVLGVVPHAAAEVAAVP